MNTQTTFTQSLSSFHHPSLLLGLLFLLLSVIGQGVSTAFDSGGYAQRNPPYLNLSA